MEGKAEAQRRAEYYTWEVIAVHVIVIIIFS